ncbi:type II toxin-antitoxin system RelE/ParE family toxin [Dyella sp. Tek66A03]|uniref:type II toxin-antitoxin system RelE/ParE family toxin n=1 Tax=Dyella sp. Tek66A03 TaxID=3458298 RepID=UPI00403E843E
MEAGLVDADLGSLLYKKRVARLGGGKSGGYRTLLSARIGSRYVFLHGFPKSDKANITQDERKALQFAGKVFLELSAEALVKALEIGVLLEVCCDEQAH